MNLNNTETAFKIKSSRELKTADFLFSMIKYPRMVKILGSLSNIALKIGFPIGWAVKPTLYRHFVGGETIEECIPAVEKLSAEKVCSILDFSVEAAKNEKDIERAYDEIMKSVINSGKHESIPFSVFKPTSLVKHEILRKVSDNDPLSDNESIEYEKFENRFESLCIAAEKAGKPIMVDAEDYRYQKAIDDITESMMLKYNKKRAVVYNTLQMYRRDRLDYLKNQLETARREGIKLGIKFVRGAYMEKERARAAEGGYPDPIFPTKQDTDNAFDEAIEIAIENIEITDIFCGTHNEESVAKLAECMQRKGLPKGYKGIITSQLYGMSDNLTFNSAAEGYRASKYVPYGKVKDVLPYLIRRAQENTAIAGQTSRELNMIKKEIKRRRNIR